MRDILFKAKRIDNGEWVEGAYFPKTKYAMKKNRTFIWVWQIGKFYCDYNCGYSPYEVDEKTICQYTGLKDKNDKKIFEGDLILLMDRWYCAVEYDVENARFILNGEYVKNEDEDEVTHSSFAPYYQNEIEVVGNIFDNLELLNADNEASQQAHQEVFKSATE